MSSAAPQQHKSKSKKLEDAKSAPILPGGDAHHPLQHAWTLWFFKNDRSRSWEENQKAVLSVQTVEDFWAVVNHIEVASKLQNGCDYSLFKAGIKPMWEDENNYRGGRWLITLDRRQRNLHLDNYWLEVMLCLIGEAFGPYGHLVNGAVISVRTKGDKIGIWLGDATEESAVLEIGKILKERLGIKANVHLAFEVHQDTMKRTGSTVAKSKYVL